MQLSMTTAMIKFVLVTAAVGAGSGYIALAAQQPARPEVFSAAQAAAGRAAYESSCINCHSDTLIPAAGAEYMGQVIPPLAGASFMARWGARTTNDLSSRIKEAVGGFPPRDLWTRRPT